MIHATDVNKEASLHYRHYSTNSNQNSLMFIDAPITVRQV